MHNFVGLSPHGPPSHLHHSQLTMWRVVAQVVHSYVSQALLLKMEVGHYCDLDTSL